MANKAEAHWAKKQISNDINISDMVLFLNRYLYVWIYNNASFLGYPLAYYMCAQGFSWNIRHSNFLVILTVKIKLTKSMDMGRTTNVKR